jgi:hypothetical protein
MEVYPLARFSAWQIALVTLVLVGVALEAGFRMSHPRRRLLEGAATLQGAVLALVGLLLAFSFSLSEQRFDLRRHVVVDEANAIGTLYLRTGLWSEPARFRMRDLLRRYLDVRIESYASGIRELAGLAPEADRLQYDLWSLLEQEAPRLPAPTLLLSTQALNQVIDLGTVRRAEFENRLPDSVVYMLLLAVLGAGLLIGYRPEGKQRGVALWAIFAVLVSGLLFVLLDLDRPRRGLIQVSQRPLLLLRESLQSRP